MAVTEAFETIIKRFSSTPKILTIRALGLDLPWICLGLRRYRFARYRFVRWRSRFVRYKYIFLPNKYFVDGQDVCKVCLTGVFKTCFENVFKKSWRPANV